jgi:hypothetical protein
LARARKSCAFDVPLWIPSAAPISSCVYPSTSCITNTVRHPSGSASIASASRCVRSGSERRGAAISTTPSSSGSSRASRRFPAFRAFAATEKAMRCSQVDSDASPRNWSSRWKARMNVSCVMSRAASSSPASRYASR